MAELSVDGSQLLYSAEYPSGGAGRALAIDQNGVLHVAGATGLVSTITPGQPVSSRIFGIINAAGGQLSGRIAPGEVISIFGTSVGPTTPATAMPDASGFFPTTLGGVQVLVNGAAIPLLYVSASQINAEIPLPLAGVTNGSAIVGVVNGSAALPDFRVAVDSAIFAFFLNSDGTIAAINQDGTLNSASNPAPAGTFVSMWATGFGDNGGLSAGSVTPAADNWCSYCQVTVGGSTETVSYAGSAPGLIDGIMQINFMVPSAFDSYTSATEVNVNLNGFGFDGMLWVGP